MTCPRLILNSGITNLCLFLKSRNIKWTPVIEIPAHWSLSLSSGFEIDLPMTPLNTHIMYKIVPWWFLSCAIFWMCFLFRFSYNYRFICLNARCYLNVYSHLAYVRGISSLIRGQSIACLLHTMGLLNNQFAFFLMSRYILRLCIVIWSQWRHSMGTLSNLLALCEGNPPMTGGFPSQGASNTQLWCFLCC